MDEMNDKSAQDSYFGNLEALEVTFPTSPTANFQL